MNVRLYFAAGMPARATLRIIWQMSSICRSRSGSLPSRMAGFSLREISLELSGQRHHVEREAERLDALAQTG